MAERRYLGSLEQGKHFSPLCLPRDGHAFRSTPRRSGPIYVLHWGYYDGTANLPMIYVLSLEDSSTDMVDTLVDGDKLKRGDRHSAAGGRAAQPGAGAPVRRFLRPQLGLFADAFDDRHQSRQGFPDAASQAVAPLRAGAVLFGRRSRSTGWSSTRSCRRSEAPENAVDADLDAAGNLFEEREARAKGLVVDRSRRRRNSTSNTDDLEAARMGVSGYSRSMPWCRTRPIRRSMPQARRKAIFAGYKMHIISGQQGSAEQC